MSKRKLLLADDSVTIQKVVNLTFADEGIEVISVGDGDSAMEKVSEIMPDLIMADVNMPGLTGYEICERIRQDENLRQTPVILLVGSFEPFDEDEARRVGADDYLTKPFQSIRQLVNKVTVLLQSKNNDNGDGVALKESSSLEDTLEMDAEELKTSSQSAHFDDTGFDDEMIQTNRPSQFAFDETQKFESRETGDLVQPQGFSNQLNEVEKIDETPIFSDSPPQLVRISDDYDEPVSFKDETEEISLISTEDSVSDEIADANEELIEIKDESELVSYELKDDEGDIEEIKDEYNSTAEIKDEKSLSPEIERNEYSYQLETSSGVTYELKDEIADEVSEKEITDEIQDSVEISDEVSKPAEIVDEIEETEELHETKVISDETEESLDLESTTDISDEIQDKQELTETEEDSEATEGNEAFADDVNSEELKEVEETSDETVLEENTEEETILERVEDDFDDTEEVESHSTQVKDYEFVSDEVEAPIEATDSIEETESELLSESELPQIEDEVEEIVDSESGTEQVSLVEKSTDEEIPLPEFASVLEFDDDDLLQLPPIENEPEEEIETSAIRATETNSTQPIGFVAVSENNTIIDSSTISPELIEMIVAKVLERLSEKVIKEVAWEVVPQMTELIVKKMAEEKLKE